MNTGMDESIIENLPLEVILKNVIITDAEVLDNKTIILTEKEGDMFPNDQKSLKISARGLGNGLRGIHDGCTYFGLKTADNNNTIVNDFLLNCKNVSNDNTNLIFCIYFLRETKKYYLRRLTNSPNFFIYMRVEKKLYFKDKHFLLVGESFIDLEVQENNALKIVYGNNLKKQTKTISNKKQILIGRKDGCDIQFDESYFSKVHITIEHEDNAKLYSITDGHNDQKSTNGIWVLKDCYEITDHHTFKIDKSLFDITLQ